MYSDNAASMDFHYIDLPFDKSKRKRKHQEDVCVSFLAENGTSGGEEASNVGIFYLFPFCFLI